MSAQPYVRPADEASRVPSQDQQDQNGRQMPPAAANDAGLASFHINSEAHASNLTGRIVGAIVVLLMLVAGGAYVYTLYANAPTPPVSDTQLPNTPPVQ
jgi:hypothetical protein